MGKLIGIAEWVLSLILGRQVSLGERAGQAEQKVNDLNDTVTALNAEAKAAAEAPTDKQSLIDTLKAGKICVLGALFLSLASCASPVAGACPQPRQWSPSQQDEIAANLATLPQDSPLIGALVEWERLDSNQKHA